MFASLISDVILLKDFVFSSAKWNEVSSAEDYEITDIKRLVTSKVL